MQLSSALLIKMRPKDTHRAGDVKPRCGMTPSVGSSGVGTGSAFLQRQTDTQRTIDSTNSLALPFQDSGIPTEEITQSSRANRKDDRADEPQQDEKNPQDR